MSPGQECATNERGAAAGPAAAIHATATRVYGYLFARKKFHFLNKALFQLSLRGLGILNFQSAAASGEKHFLRGYLRGIAGPVVFDVGANQGNYTSDVLAVNPSARIFGFEPHPVTFARLSERLAPRGVEVINAACGRAEGEMKLYDFAADGSERASLYQGVIEQLHHKQAREYTVRILDLDTFASERGVDHIDLLKIDTEGHELEVLAGATRLLREGRVRAVQLEFNEMNVISRTYFRDFRAVLEGYDLYRMVRDGLIPINLYSPVTHEIFGFQNIVALPHATAP